VTQIRKWIYHFFYSSIWPCACIHSLTHLFILFIHSFIYSFIHTFIHSFIYSFIPLSTHEIRPFIYSFTHLSIHSFHSFIHSFIHFAVLFIFIKLLYCYSLTINSFILNSSFVMSVSLFYLIVNWNLYCMTVSTFYHSESHVLSTFPYIPGIVIVPISGHLLEVTLSWKSVFHTNAILLIVGSLIFLIFGTAKKIV